MKKKKGKRKAVKWLIAAAALLVLVVLVPAVISLLSEELETTFYHVYSPKMSSGCTVRFVVLADLHNSEYGENNEELVQLVRALKPDVILGAGDFVNKDEEEVSITLNLCRQLQEIAPFYFGLGNHEGTMIYENGIRLDQMLMQEGIPVLVNSWDSIIVKENELLIGGISANPDSYDMYAADFVEEFAQNDAFKVLITHQPDLYYEKMAETHIDLGVCGHFHGGQIRLPVAGGLYSEEYGLFPEYCDGMFRLTNSTIVVSRGLGSHTYIPRINNRPEVVVIDVNARKSGE